MSANDCDLKYTSGLIDIYVFHRYVTDDGRQVNGKAIRVSTDLRSLYIMKGQDAPFYWVNFSEYELKNEVDFDKIVRAGN